MPASTGCFTTTVTASESTVAQLGAVPSVTLIREKVVVAKGITSRVTVCEPVRTMLLKLVPSE